MSRLVDERPFYFLHEICRGPVAKLDLYRHVHPTNRFKSGLLYRFTHLSGDTCTRELSFVKVMSHLDVLTSEIQGLISQGIGYRCPVNIPNSYAWHKQQSDVYWRGKTPPDYLHWMWKPGTAEQIQGWKKIANTPPSLVGIAGTYLTRRPALWPQLEGLSTHTGNQLFLPRTATGLLCCGKQGMFPINLRQGLPDRAGKTHDVPTLPRGDYFSDLQRNGKNPLGETLTTLDRIKQCHGVCTRWSATCREDVTGAYDPYDGFLA